VADASPDPVPWILDGNDPSLTWRVLTELRDRPEDDPEVAGARAQIGSDGWAAKILAEQLPTGQWVSAGTSAKELYTPKYIATNWRLIVLSDLGVTREHPGVSRAVELMFTAEGGPEGGLHGTGAELCYTGNAARMLARFGYLDDPRVSPIFDWLVRTQKADGGWYCWEGESGSLDCWEALAAFAAIPPTRRSAEMRRAIERGAEFYLSRGLLGIAADDYPPWRRMHYPVHYYYDFLVGLDVLSRLGYGRDPRMHPALDHLESLRNPDGTWDMGPAHPDLPTGEIEYRPATPNYPFVLEYSGRPSRWLTLTALAVLRRAARAA
jgi:hypothetical protein